MVSVDTRFSWYYTFNSCRQQNIITGTDSTTLQLDCTPVSSIPLTPVDNICYRHWQYDSIVELYTSLIHPFNSCRQHTVCYSTDNTTLQLDCTPVSSIPLTPADNICYRHWQYYLMYSVHQSHHSFSSCRQHTVCYRHWQY
jgi:hypothetical protein